MAKRRYHAFLQQVMLAAHAPTAAVPPMKRPRMKVKPIPLDGMTYGGKAKSARTTLRPTTGTDK